MLKTLNPFEQFAVSADHHPITPTRVRHKEFSKYGAGWAISYTDDTVRVIWDNWKTEINDRRWSDVNHDKVELE